MNSITYFALLLFSFSWLAPVKSSNTAYAPQPDGACKSYYDATLNLTVYTGVDKEPEYPGGSAAWGRYINRNLNEANLNPKIDCNVRIKMIVDSAGGIRKAVAIHGDTEVKEPNVNEKEVLRVYTKSGAWAPGTCGGKNVTAEFVQSFKPCNLE
jgi:hypothetical protein